MNEKLRVLALIPPIEKHVGHWACSTPSLRVERVLMEGDVEDRVLAAAERTAPQAVAIIGKFAPQYNDLLDRMSACSSLLKGVPRVYRTQNTNLAQSGFSGPATRAGLTGSPSHWARFAADPRFSLVFVQTLTDVEIFRQALSPVLVSLCPFGVDESIFRAEETSVEPEIDVGCYFRLKGQTDRIRLVETAEAICGRRGWQFRFCDSLWGRDYAELIHRTKVCLHMSKCGDVPFRLVEVTAMRRVFLTDPLGSGVERIYCAGQDYFTYCRDLSDLESVLLALLLDDSQRQRIAASGYARSREFTWTAVAERYVVSALRLLLKDRHDT